MRLLPLAALFVAATLGPPALTAQGAIGVALGGGASLPTDELDGDASAGWNALAALVIGVPMHPIGLRVDAAYSQFGLGGGHESLASATLNLTYRLPMTRSLLSPYLIAGAGGYRTDCGGGAACADGTRFGWNAGLGTRLRLFALTTFVEARYHRAGERGAYVPVTFGATH